MSSPQDRYTDAVRQGQEAMTAAVESWTDSAQKAMGAVPGSAEAMAPQQVIDQVFDFAEKMLQVQREFAKKMAETAASASESARQHSETMADAVRSSTEQTTQAVQDAVTPR